MANNSQILKSIAAMEKELAAMRLLVSDEGSKGSSAVAAPKKVKKVVQEGEEVVKKAPNAWILFTSRLNTLIKSTGKEIPVAQQKTFGSMLKKLGGESYTEMSDEDILKQLEGWECPEPTPRKKKDSASETSSDAGSEKKARKPQSEETKAKAALKRAATKAAKAASAEAPEPEAAAEPVPVKKSAPASPKKQAAANPDALRFNSWSYEGEDCWQNDRGDSLNPEGEWMGRMVKGKMTMTAQSDMPGDLEPFIQELME